VIIIGQAPGPRGDGEPLSGQAGRRLSALCGLTVDAYLAQFERVNLLTHFPGKAGKGDAFPLPAARKAAAALLPALEGRRVVLLGGKVAAAFGLQQAPLLVWRPLGGAMVAVAPHPSGINRWWNDPRNVRRARRFWRTFSRNG
jgi:uracil-DNA glycosylase